MEYLTKINKKAKCSVHVWDGDDTLCRMASTGGLRMERFAIVQDKCGRKVCKNCINVGFQENKLSREDVFQLELDNGRRY